MLEPLVVGPLVNQKSFEIKKQEPLLLKEEKPSDYRWVVDVASVGGAIVGGICFGVPGAIIGGALLAGGAVPLRRYLAERENPKALEREMSAGAEIGVNVGSTLLFGALFAGVAGVARIAATRISAAVTARIAAQTSAQTAERSFLQKAVEKGWKPLKTWYVSGGHIGLRFAAGGVAAYDLTHNKKGEWDPADDSLDTGVGFASSIYSANLLYSKFFGANIFGLDVAAPMSIATYQMIRVIAGAKKTDLGNFNYNEASRFRYMNEFANILQNVATYGRAYLRPDLRAAIAASRGLTASRGTGTETVSPFGWLVDNSFGALYRSAPEGFQNIVKPTVAFRAGPPQWAERFRPDIAERLTVVKGFKNSGDMMKPDMGPAGRVLSLAQVWGLVVPYQIYAAPLLGMKGGQWGAHRLWKFTAWPLIGNPIQASLGGDTAVAKAVGFTVGMGMDGAITLFYNPRYEKREWAWDLHQSLADFRKAKTKEEKEAIAGHIVHDIYRHQMTDWNLKSFAAGQGLRKLNDDYRRTFLDEMKTLTPEDLSVLEQILSY